MTSNTNDLVTRLRTRAVIRSVIRRNTISRNSAIEDNFDQVTNLLIEAADMIEKLEKDREKGRNFLNFFKIF